MDPMDTDDPFASHHPPTSTASSSTSCSLSPLAELAINFDRSLSRGFADTSLSGSLNPVDSIKLQPSLLTPECTKATASPVDTSPLFLPSKALNFDLTSSSETDSPCLNRYAASNRTNFGERPRSLTVQPKTLNDRLPWKELTNQCSPGYNDEVDGFCALTTSSKAVKVQGSFNLITDLLAAPVVLRPASLSVLDCPTVEAGLVRSSSPLKPKDVSSPIQERMELSSYSPSPQPMNWAKRSVSLNSKRKDLNEPSPISSRKRLRFRQFSPLKASPSLTREQASSEDVDVHTEASYNLSDSRHRGCIVGAGALISDPVAPSASFLDYASPRKLSRSMSCCLPSFDPSRLLGNDHHACIGDFSKPYCLPKYPGKVNDLFNISAETLVDLLSGHYTAEVERYTIIDCRYPYEYNGGHVRGAINIYTKQGILDQFINSSLSVTTRRDIIIFHCEFSSKRGPELARFLRNQDRERHASCYPQLFYPEIYLLHGGYKQFFESCKSFCEPDSYVTMDDKRFEEEFKLYKKQAAVRPISLRR